MFYLLLVALAMTGELMPEEHNRFYVLANGAKPLLLIRAEEDIWHAKQIDRENLTYIPQGQFHLNGLAIGQKTEQGFDYYDMSEMLSIESVNDLARREFFEVSDGHIYADRHYHLKEKYQGLKLRYSSADISDPGFSITVLWEKKPNLEMLLAMSGSRKLKHADIDKLSIEQLNLARNEIFARHGYIFKSKPLSFYFNSTSWYRPTTKEVVLSDIEKYNVELLQHYEVARTNKANITQRAQQSIQFRGDYLIPDSDIRLLEQAELMKYSQQELRLIRNEIFARHGFVFQSAELNEYFLKKPWYHPLADDAELTDVEAENVRLIKLIEKSKLGQ
ncbi:YARHG domain-containing protein [Motilimonas eburnea]|uniref:YARHG domain-containing protein n=1 Tax=Motilimonas eburnea TaxID=1737488 RepID=UPI001E2B4A56|nr:YARHG domain-containing protein [Motilimonas eburnea]MCE2570537.1 YARHG domain-containing protein [Motilimonas eburnea]